MAILDDLLAALEFENDLLDSSGNGHHGSSTTAPTYVAGVVGQALQPGGPNSLFISPALVIGTGSDNAFTVEAIVKVSSFPSLSAILAAPGFHGLYVDGGSSPPGKFMYYNGAYQQSTGVAVVGSWVHVVASYDGAVMRWYVGGVAAGTNTFTLPGPGNPFAPVYIADSNGAAPFAGGIEHIRVWGRAVDAAEAAFLYNGGSYRSFANLEPAPAPTVTSVTPNTGTTQGGTALTVTGTGFVNGATVFVGGVVTEDVIWVNSTTLTCFTTTGADPGLGDVVVTNPDAQFGTLEDAFTTTVYVEPPVFTKYGTQLSKLLPPGALWDLEGSSSTHQLLLGVGDEFQRVELRGEDLIEESDPRTATETIAEWERTVGLPDEEVTEISADIAERRVAVTQKLVSRTGQNLEFYELLCERCGYPLLSLHLYRADVLRVGFLVGARVFGDAYSYAILLSLDTPTAGALTQAQFEAVVRKNTHSHIQVVFSY